jgi:putative sterol carrier protein
LEVTRWGAIGKVGFNYGGVNMAILFPTDEWIKALHNELNRSKDYKEAAQKWEGDICFVIKKGAGVPGDTYLYLDLWHGMSRDAYESSTPIRSEFTISAPLTTWKRVIEGKLDPIRGIMSRQLKLSGPMTKILKAPKAAVELVNCATKIDTEWPV